METDDFCLHCAFINNKYKSRPTNYKTRKALLLTGHLRTFEKTYKSLFKNIIQNKEIDVFIWTWETLEVPQPKRGTENGLANINTWSRFDQIKNIYNPIDIKIENYLIRDKINDHCRMAPLNQQDRGGFFGGDLLNFASMIYGWKQVYEMMVEYEDKVNIKYDWILRTRTDLIFPDGVNIINHDVREASIYTPNIATFYANGCNDQLCYGDHKGMEVYCKFYDYLPHYVRNRVVNPLRPETILKYHLMNSNIEFNMFGIKYYMYRANGDILIPQGPNQLGVRDYKLIQHVM
jgi:hypothetical protein